MKLKPVDSAIDLLKNNTKKEALKKINDFLEFAGHLLSEETYNHWKSTERKIKDIHERNYNYERLLQNNKRNSRW